jgi:ferredoxin--NADP+ reductase
MTEQALARLAKLPKAWIVKKQEVASDLFLIWLRPEVPFTFKPGQYITIGTSGIERPYSIASAPNEPLIELFIEHVLPEYGGKLTPLLWNQHVGESVSMRPRAKGIFVFRPEYYNHVMVGTVTGVAPFVSMLRSAIHEKTRGHRFFIMEGASHQNEFVYDTELMRREDELSDMITFIATVSRPDVERNRSWNGPTGRVNTLVEGYLAKWSLPKDDTLIYLCGNPGMIEDVTERLTPKGWHVDSERFWKEGEAPEGTVG